MREKEIQVAVEVDVGGGHGERGTLVAEIRLRSCLNETTTTVVAKDFYGALLNRDEILVPVGIEIDEVGRPLHFLGRDAPIVLDPYETTTVVVKEPAHRVTPVRHVELEPRFVVHVDKRQAAAFPDTVLFRRIVLRGDVLYEVVKAEVPRSVPEQSRTDDGRRRRDRFDRGRRRRFTASATSAAAGNETKSNRQQRPKDRYLVS